MRSLFTPLKNEGLTTLKIRYDWKTGKVRYEVMKQWEPDQDFSKYNKDFYVQSIMTEDVKYYNTDQVIELFKKYDVYDYLLEVVDLIKKGKHFGIECYYNDKYNIRFMCNQHNRKLGALNKRQATLAGGIRRHGFDDNEIDVIIDGLNLSRAMSFKSVAADLDFGGSKTTVHMDPVNMENEDMMGFIAFAIDNCRTMTGPDMYFPNEMSDVMLSKGLTAQFNGGPKSPLGQTGKPTAYGAYLALKEAMKFRKGTESLDGLTIAVQGLGSVGWFMAEHFVEENTKLIITDINKEVGDRFISEHSNSDIKFVSTDEIMNVKADILCPCAMGGIISKENINELKFDTIFGPANNQLRASSQIEEIELANMLEEAGILFQPDWWHNIAGYICGAEDHIEGLNADYNVLLKKIEEIIPRRTKENLNRSKEQGITPTEAAYSFANSTIYGE